MFNALISEFEQRDKLVHILRVDRAILLSVNLILIHKSRGSQSRGFSNGNQQDRGFISECRVFPVVFPVQ